MRRVAIMYEMASSDLRCASSLLMSKKSQRHFEREIRMARVKCSREVLNKCKNVFCKKQKSYQSCSVGYYVGDNTVKLARDIKLCWFNITHGEYSCPQLYGRPALR